MDLSKLLTPEAIATYIVAIASLTFGAIGFFAARWVSRQRPRRVKFLRVNSASLVEVSPEVKSEITLNYRGKPIKSLHLTEFSLRNQSDDVLDNIEINVEYDEAEVFDVIMDDIAPERRSSVIVGYSSSNLQLALKFLNSERLYKDRIGVKVLSSEPIRVKKVAGVGRNWKAEYYDVEELRTAVLEDMKRPSYDMGAMIRLTVRAFQLIRAIYQ